MAPVQPGCVSGRNQLGFSVQREVELPSASSRREGISYYAAFATSRVTCEIPSLKKVKFTFGVFNSGTFGSLRRRFLKLVSSAYVRGE